MPSATGSKATRNRPRNAGPHSEGPAWDVKTQCLYWLDVLQKRVDRFNDAKCDSAGRFLSGSMDMNEKAPSGAQVTCWNPQTGELLEQILLPAKNVSSCVVGGANLDGLCVTSARVGLGNADLAAYKHSGG